ncbi:MAG: hypothetical protein M1275_02605 [Patescibacteria group bacterium]|nr:hypothetical protein [Patescibacteria group bacterium]
MAPSPPDKKSPKEPFFLSQVLPLALTAVVFVALFGILYLAIILLNRFTPDAPIVLELRWPDVLFGLTIYLKTSVDFAIFIGNLMRANPGYKSRIAVEIGTALGNAAGTLAILALWNYFKGLDFLLAAMVFVAALVLLRLAQDGLQHGEERTSKGTLIGRLSMWLDRFLGKFNDKIDPFLSKIVPHTSFKQAGVLKFWPLFFFAFTIPFILGLDDFAGYVPLFSIVNVFGFATGVLLGHMILNALLYLSPIATIKAVTNAWVAFAGSVVFVGLSIYGFTEVAKILLGH